MFAHSFSAPAHSRQCSNTPILQYFNQTVRERVARPWLWNDAEAKAVVWGQVGNSAAPPFGDHPNIKQSFRSANGVGPQMYPKP
jgi:hypothetical protein